MWDYRWQSGQLRSATTSSASTSTLGRSRRSTSGRATSKMWPTTGSRKRRKAVTSSQPRDGPTGTQRPRRPATSTSRSSPSRHHSRKGCPTCPTSRGLHSCSGRSRTEAQRSCWSRPPTRAPRTPSSPMRWRWRPACSQGRLPPRVLAGAHRPGEQPVHPREHPEAGVGNDAGRPRRHRDFYKTIVARTVRVSSPGQQR